MKNSRILVATDFSPCAKVAITYACGLARHLDAELTVLHVLDLPDFTTSELTHMNVDLQHFYERMQARARARMTEELAEIPAARDLDIHERLRLGPAAQEVAAEMAELQIDVAVVGTHGRTGVAHLTLGSVAEKIVRQAPGAVIGVRESHERQVRAWAETPDKPIPLMLLPTDTSEESLAALPMAVELAREVGARLRLVQVVEELVAYPDVDWEHLPSPEEIQKSSQARAEAELRELARTRIPESVPFECQVRRGNPYLQIVDAAADCDLIAMSTHGRSGLSRFWLGSVAEKVLRGSPCPVMTIRQKK